MKTMVMIPTYNERENITPLLDEIMNLEEDLEVLVIDDDSPDGTWKIVKNYTKKNSRVHLLRRTSERGRGLAGIAGFKYTLENKADYIIEMDGDLSHDPRYIPKFLKKIKDCDVVIGSRFLPGGRDMGRGFLRRTVSRLACLYIRALLGFRVTDPTSGYRCFRRKVLEEIGLDSLKARDPFIVTEVLYRIHKKNFRIKEVPITFQSRKYGASKLGLRTLMGNVIQVLFLRIRGK